MLLENSLFVDIFFLWVFVVKKESNAEIIITKINNVYFNNFFNDKNDKSLDKDVKEIERKSFTF